jgi:cyclic-di-GMP phosphodiesterase TipF (flagellum assembly factor)
MRLGIVDYMVGCAYALGAGVAGLALVRIAGAEPSLGLAAGGLLFILCADMHAANVNRRALGALTRELKSLRAEHAAFKAETAMQLERAAVEAPAALATPEPQTEELDRTPVSDMRVLEDLVRRLSDQPVTRPGAVPAPRQPDTAMLEAVKSALEDNRVDLYLQPIVTLPQRRVRYYESFTRLRSASGQVIMPAEFLPAAREADLMSAIDNMLLFRCVQIVRRLAQKERRVGVFCNVSVESLADPDFFPQFMDFMRRNADLADSLIFEIGQTAFTNRSLEAARGVARLADFGFRFSIDHVQTLDVDIGEMQRSGVKFFKAPGRLLAEVLASGREVGGVAVQDFAASLARQGIELIAEKIEDESTVVEALEFDVALGQGHLFGEPRPIRDQTLVDAAPMVGHLRAVG